MTGIPFDFVMGMTTGIVLGALVAYILLGDPKDYHVGFRDGVEFARRRGRR